MENSARASDRGESRGDGRGRQRPRDVVDGKTRTGRDHDTSPRTGAKLEMKALFPCTSLRIIIRKFVEETGRA